MAAMIVDRNGLGRECYYKSGIVDDTQKESVVRKSVMISLIKTKGRDWIGRRGEGKGGR
jgi:hypothetical protein